MSSILDLVGNTPMVELSRLQPNPRVKLYAKLEGNNPGGSVKDRPAKSMILKAVERGTLKPGMKLVEPTSGNTGIALAMIAAVAGYEMHLVMPESATAERVRTMRAYGAVVHLTPADKGMEGTIDYARAMVARGGFVMLDQFSNPDNPLAHYETTGPEIWRDTEGKVTHFVSSMGTTGTIMGCSRYLKEVSPSVQIIGAHPSEGSCIPGIRKWPKEYLPKIFEEKRVDRILEVTQAQAETMARALAAREGVFAGISSGGVVHAALEVCKGLEQGVVVCIICDRGDRYLSASVFG
ncbi:MAG TPA: cysteine synthase CysM [Fibrobacteria bacterium]|jgi:cysteine synthase B|nr:cysteine synthase CysM [Fibrobacteria bacterium]